MDFEKVKSVPNPWSRANFLSKIFFWWITPLFLKGWKGNLKKRDIYDCPDVESSEKLGEAIQKEWDKELKKHEAGMKPSLVKALIRTFGSTFGLYSIMAIVSNIIQLAPPVLLGYMVRLMAQFPSGNTRELYLCVAGICSLTGIFSMLLQHFLFEAVRLGMRVRIACSALIYRKALKLSQATVTMTSVGQMVNFLSNDVNKFDRVGVHLPYIFVAPVRIFLSVCILWTYISYASVAGVSLLLFYIPIQLKMWKLFSNLRTETAFFTDKRIHLMSEIIGGMRFIKMYGWEFPFAKLVEASRREEMQKISRTAFLRAANFAIFFIFNKVVGLISITVFVLLLLRDLTPEVVFVCLLFFNGMSIPMAYCFPQSIALAAEAIMSLERIQKFLLLEENSDILQLETPKLKHSECRIVTKNISAAWNKDIVACLRDITLDLKPGDLLAVIGPVGCGKTSLLLTILGELPTLSGERKVRGRMAYASQEPWIFGGSVRQNIVFGGDFDEDKYNQVLSVCALSKDIDMLPYGDQTIVGDKGVKLSGGQKARVSLARATYFDADIILLDDPLSAVDSAVSRHLLDNCFNGYLKNKIRILTTHQIHFLKEASQILVLKEGMCLFLGTYQQLTESRIDLGFLLGDQNEEQPTSLDAVIDNILITDENSDGINQMPVEELKLYANGSREMDFAEENAKHLNITKTPKPTEETKIYGSIKFKVYKDYIKSGGGVFFRWFVFIVFVSTQAIYIGSDFWLINWTTLEQQKLNIKNCWGNMTRPNKTSYYDESVRQTVLGDTLPANSEHCLRVTQNYTMDVQDVGNKYDDKFRLCVYGGLILILLLLSGIREMAFFQMCMTASKTLHDKIFRSILRSPIAFFDSNPFGIILNRVSQDLGIIDDVIPITSADVFEIVCGALGTICVASIVQPYMLLPSFFLIIIMVFLRRFFLCTARDVKRYEGITRSPVFSLMSTSLTGLTIIRAFKVQRKFESSFQHHLDQHSAAAFAYLSVSQWFTNCIDILCLIYTTIVTVSVVLFTKDPSYATYAALAITSALQLIGRFQNGARQSVDLESQMTSVERVLEYFDLKPEAALESDPEKLPPKNWPFTGHIVYRGVSLRYSPDEPAVLKDLNFEIYSGEKIGIVGRTGAGKSSILASLFRMTEPEGRILVDGICIQDIGLHDLRKRITIIPQNPMLYIGTIRKNLDLLSEHCDSELWKALEEVSLKECIFTIPGALDAEISDGGNNFSVGQRQLICLARAILRKNHIIVLDEATSNIDLNTDTLIQNTIRNRFKHCTVLTIAHRLHTVMDSDRLMVLEAGRLKEFDAPYNLLLNPLSLLSQMLHMMGPIVEDELKNIAFATHLNNLARKESAFNSDGDIAEKEVIDINEFQLNTCDDGSNLKCYANETFEDNEKTHL